MKNVVLFFICLFLIQACTCEEEGITVIEEPNPFYVVQVGGADDFFFVEFSKPVDQQSFIFGENALFIPTRTCANDISWSDDETVMSFCAIYDDCNNTINCRLTVQLIGTEGNATIPIRSTTGQLLDGDFDGNDGGNFIRQVMVTR